MLPTNSMATAGRSLRVRENLADSLLERSRSLLALDKGIASLGRLPFEQGACQRCRKNIRELKWSWQCQ